MTNIVTIVSDYMCTSTATADLSPKTWDDVSDWYIKWDTLYVKFDGSDDWKEFELDSDTEIDSKRPMRVDVYEGQNEYDITLASQEGF